jgi:hypothetical protein
MDLLLLVLRLGKVFNSEASTVLAEGGTATLPLTPLARTGTSCRRVRKGRAAAVTRRWRPSRHRPLARCCIQTRLGSWAVARAVKRHNQKGDVAAVENCLGNVHCTLLQ